MPLDQSGQEQRRSTTKAHLAPPTEAEHLPCPRCDSTNTKFCYYNNYNFSQPRHFCKACRRYWTHGGTLRDIPVGGGSRKNNNAKRSRAPSSSSFAAATDCRQLPATAATPIFLPFTGGGGVNMCGSFTSLLNTQGPSAGLLTLGGTTGFEDIGFGLGRAAVWPFSAVGDCGANGNILGHMWHLESGGLANGDLF